MSVQDLKFFIQLNKLGTIVSRKFDGSLGGLGWSEFILLYHLSQAEGKKLRRIDLAEKAGLTASGVTRILLPMEKVGYISKEINAEDARVSLVMIASGGQQKLDEALDRIEPIVEELLASQDSENITGLSKVLETIGGAILWK